MKNEKDKIVHKIAKGTFSFIMTASMVFSVGALAACEETPKTPVDHNPPVTNPDEEKKPTTPNTTTTPSEEDNDKEKEEQQKQQELATAKVVYSGFISGLKQDKNFTFTEKNGNKYEFDNDKAKFTLENATEYIYEENGALYKHTLDENGKWAKEENSENTFENILNDVLDNITFANKEWEKYDGSILYGATVDGESVTAKLDNNILTVTIGEKIIIINNVGETSVELPIVEEEKEFDVTTPENLAKFQANLQEHLQKIAGLGAAINEVYNIYLKQGESGLVDTIGAVMNITSRNSTSERFLYGELIIKNLQQNLTYKDICENGLEYDSKQVSSNDIFTVSITQAQQEQYKEGIDILFDGLLGENARDGAVWSGWLGASGMGMDGHNLYLFKNNGIQHIRLAISNNGSTLGLLESINKNFVNKEESNALNTWEILDTETIEIPEDSINIWKLTQEQNA